MPKRLQKSSEYAKYDVDGDGVVTDEELAHVKEIKETETKLRKNLAQLRMARYTLIGMGVFTVALFFVPIDRVKALSDVSNLLYISGSSIVGFYMGSSAYMAKNGKQMVRKDPKVGTGKKPKGSGRRLYTDENPKDTVKIKYATVADARATARKVKNINKPFA